VTQTQWPPTNPGRFTMQPQTVWCTLQGNIELMPKKEVLDFKPAPRPRCADSVLSRESVRMRFLGTTAGSLI
jgi:hypothetical protein